MNKWSQSSRIVVALLVMHRVVGRANYSADRLDDPAVAGRRRSGSNDGLHDWYHHLVVNGVVVNVLVDMWRIVDQGANLLVLLVVHGCLVMLVMVMLQGSL